MERGRVDSGTINLATLKSVHLVSTKRSSFLFILSFRYVWENLVFMSWRQSRSSELES